MPVKRHKAADKALRSLKKRGPMQRQSRYVFLASPACAQALITYLQEAPTVQAQVIVLCDRCHGRHLAAAEEMAANSHGVAKVANTWEKAVAAAASAAAMFTSSP